MSAPVKYMAMPILLSMGALGACASDNGNHVQHEADLIKTPQFRGVFFNPQINTSSGQPWLACYSQCRAQVCAALHELAGAAGINLVVIFVCIPDTLKKSTQAPQEGQPLGEWANLAYLDNVAAFIEDCHDAGVSVELDLAANMWIPYSVDPEHQLSNKGKWPKPSETPWKESATWYRETINYIEGRAKHPESIATWCMMGNFELGPAEPCLWPIDGKPAVLSSVEEFVKKVWPVFRAAGKRPKAAPIMLPIFADDTYWRDFQTALPAIDHSSEVRLSAFTNLKKWICDDLSLPPDYWIMTTYPFCDPAPDGVYYLREIVKILGPENAHRIISTDLKGPGHDNERAASIIPAEGRSGPEMLEWHFQKCAEYGFAGWWIWAYQDTPNADSGICAIHGEWKQDLLKAINQEAAPNK